MTHFSIVEIHRFPMRSWKWVEGILPLTLEHQQMCSVRTSAGYYKLSRKIFPNLNEKLKRRYLSFYARSAQVVPLATTFNITILRILIRCSAGFCNIERRQERNDEFRDLPNGRTAALKHITRPEAFRSYPHFLPRD